MSLTGVDFLPDGTRVASELALRDTVRALKDGDGILGWEGDPNMEVFVDLLTGMFDVWTLDAHGEPFVALSRPYCDQRLVVDVLAADTRRRDVAGEAMAASKRAEADAEAAFSEEVEDCAERLQFALRKDLGHLFGGTRPFHSMTGAR